MNHNSSYDELSSLLKLRGLELTQDEVDSIYRAYLHQVKIELFISTRQIMDECINKALNCHSYEGP